MSFEFFVKIFINQLREMVEYWGYGNKEYDRVNQEAGPVGPHNRNAG